MAFNRSKVAGFYMVFMLLVVTNELVPTCEAYGTSPFIISRYDGWYKFQSKHEKEVAKAQEPSQATSTPLITSPYIKSRYDEWVQLQSKQANGVDNAKKSINAQATVTPTNTRPSTKAPPIYSSTPNNLKPIPQRRRLAIFAPAVAACA